MKQRGDGRGRGRSLGLTRRGWAATAVACAGLLLSYVVMLDGLIFVAVFVAAVVLCAMLSAHHRRPRLAVHRAFSSPHLVAGHSAEVTLELANTVERAVGSGEWYDRWAWNSGSVWGAGGLEGASEPRPLPVLRARSTRSLSTARVSHTLTLPRRGEYLLGPVVVRVTDPFGLCWSEVEIGEQQSVIVVPETAALGDTGIAFAEADGSVRRLSHRAIGGDHDLTTRDYRVGDPLRRVHWRASAHHGELMVRQEEQRSNAEATILLDTRADRYPLTPLRSQADPESELFEWAVSFTASLAHYLDGSGMFVRVAETAPAQLDSSLAGTGLLEGLARLELFHGWVGDAALGPALVEGRARGGTIFAVLADADGATLHSLIEARSSFALATVFLLQGDARYEDSRAAEALGRAGWAVVTVPLGGTVEHAWSMAGEMGGRRRGW